MGYILTFSAVITGVLSAGINNIALVYWMKTDLSTYGVTLINNLYFVIAFGCLLVGHAIYYKDWSILRVADDPHERVVFAKPLKKSDGWHFTQAQMVLWIGFCFNLNSIIINFATPPYRTPPLVQTVLLNAAVLFAVPLSKIFLGDRKRYLSKWPILAGGLIVAAVFISLLPTIISGSASKGFNGAHTLAWCAIYLISNLPWAAESIAEQAYLIRCGLLEDDVTWKHMSIGILRMLTHAGLWQLLFNVLCFWVDFIPFFGMSSTPQEFWDNTVQSLACSFMGPSAVAKVGGDPSICGAQAPIFAIVASIGYFVSYIADAVLNRESAAFSMLNYVLITCATTLFFLIPGTNPNPTDTPIWSVITSIVLSVSGEIIWKKWEDQTPADEQFAVDVVDSVASKHPLAAVLDRPEGEGLLQEHKRLEASNMHAVISLPSMSLNGALVDK